MTLPLRIAIPIHSFEPGGVERVALCLAYRIRPCRVPTARFETLGMIWSFLLFLTRERVDVIFCPGNTYAVVYVALRLLLGDNCPPIVPPSQARLSRSSGA